MKRLHLWSDGIYRDGPQLWATRIRLTRLDASGQPVPDSEVFPALDATVTLERDESESEYRP